MDEFIFGSWHLSSQQLSGLVRRQNLYQLLVRRSIEEQIIDLVAKAEDYGDSQIKSFCDDNGLTDQSKVQLFLDQKQWSKEDLHIEAFRSPALISFSEDRFGSALEDIFLRKKPDLDQVLYSLLRVRDAGLARELWIQISEREISFAQAASQYGEGDESRHAGLIGPVPLGNLQPSELRQRLRRLQVGAVSEPEQFGEWYVLLRLEQILPAVLDNSMRSKLLHQEFEAWLQERSLALIDGRVVDPLDYHPRYDRNSDS